MKAAIDCVLRGIAIQWLNVRSPFLRTEFKSKCCVAVSAHRVVVVRSSSGSPLEIIRIK